MSTFFWDLRHTFRALRRDRGFTIVAVLVLAIGIGANTTVFSVVNAILLRPLPFEDPDRLVWISNQYRGNEAAGLSGVASRVVVFEEWEARSRTVEDFTAYNPFFGYESHTLTGVGEPERLVAVMVAQNVFDLLGVEPHLGRAFVDEETQENGRRAVLLSYGFWQRRFASNPDVVGEWVTLDDEPTAVVGVLPRTLDFGSVFAPGIGVDVYVPLALDVVRDWGNTLAVIGRLAPDAAVAAAAAEFEVITERMHRERSDLGRSYGAGVVDLPP